MKNKFKSMTKEQAQTEFNKLIAKARKKAKEHVLEVVPTISGYATSASGKLFIELYLHSDGEHICFKEGETKDYADIEIEILEIPDFVARMSPYEGAMGFSSVDSFTDKVGASEAYKNRLEDVSDVQKSGLLDTLYNGKTEVRFNEFAKDVVSLEVRFEGNITDYQRLSLFDLRLERDKYLKQGFTLTPTKEKRKFIVKSLDGKPLDPEEKKDIPKRRKIGDLF